MRLGYFFVFHLTLITLLSNGQANQEENYQLSSIIGLPGYQLLSLQQKGLLEKNGFFVAPSEFDQIYQIYQYGAKQGMPIYITLDAIFHTFHILFDYSLRVTELEYFYKQLEDLTKGLLAYELTALAKNKLANVKNALIKNIAYLSVAASLLDEKFVIPSLVKKMVESELELIAQSQGINQSSIFNYPEDYSQYKPRGHYTRDKKFERYFKAMMWYSRIGFYLVPGRLKSDTALGRDLTRQAILLTLALKYGYAGKEPALRVWERIYNPLTYLIGKTDDLNYYDYVKLIAQHFPDQAVFKKIESDANIDEFIKAALALRAPKILATYYLKEDTVAAQTRTKGFRLFGQRYIPDSYIFQELVFDKVGNKQKPRHLPKGLDIMAVLGSERAAEILKNIYQEHLYFNYETQLQKLKTEFKQLTKSDWNQSIYFSWFYALKLLFDPLPKSSPLPEFLFTPAYADKTLMTACGSWAQLRHDTILYAKPSYTVALTGFQPPTPRPGYVEPYPLVFLQIANVATDLVDLLKRYHILAKTIEDKLSGFIALVKRLAEISQKEVNGTELNDDDLLFMQNFGKTLEDIITFPPQSEKYLSETDDKMAVVVDVHTDPNRQQVLEVAVGKPYFIYAVIPYQKKLFLALGGVFTYYEFTKSLRERMTDEEWQNTLAGTEKPDLPVWTNSFIAQ